MFDKEYTANSSDNPKDWLEKYLLNKGLKVIDKREKGGNLWVIGGVDLKPIFKELATKGVNFTFVSNGSRTTQNKPGWYTKFKE